MQQRYHILFLSRDFLEIKDSIAEPIFLIFASMLIYWFFFFSLSLSWGCHLIVRSGTAWYSPFTSVSSPRSAFCTLTDRIRPHQTTWQGHVGPSQFHSWSDPGHFLGVLQLHPRRPQGGRAPGPSNLFGSEKQVPAPRIFPFLSVSAPKRPDTIRADTMIGSLNSTPINRDTNAKPKHATSFLPLFDLTFSPGFLWTPALWGLEFSSKIFSILGNFLAPLFVDVHLNHTATKDSTLRCLSGNASRSFSFWFPLGFIFPPFWGLLYVESCLCSVLHWVWFIDSMEFRLLRHFESCEHDLAWWKELIVDLAEYFI